MINYFTLSSVTTATDTRIYAFVIVARFVQGTFCADCTFGTARWGTANVCRQTRTNSLVVNCTALTVGATRAWITRFNAHN